MCWPQPSFAAATAHNMRGATFTLPGPLRISIRAVRVGTEAPGPSGANPDQLDALDSTSIWASGHCRPVEFNDLTRTWLGSDLFQLCSIYVRNNQIEQWEIPPRCSKSCGAGGNTGSRFCCCFCTRGGRALSKCAPPPRTVQGVCPCFWGASRANSVDRASQ